MIVGITGGIGSGKSTVSRILRDKGFYFVDLDTISHEVIQDPGIKTEIFKNFGSEIFDKEEISRKKLGKIVFEDKKKLKKLNSIMHPEILRVMRKKILECKLKKEKDEKGKNKIIFVEIQLLFEVQWEKEFDYILLVAAKRDMQVRRVLERDKRSEEEAWNIINSQMSLDEKREKSDFVIENDGNIDDLNREVDKFLKILEQQQFQKIKIHER